MDQHSSLFGIFVSGELKKKSFITFCAGGHTKSRAGSILLPQTFRKMTNELSDEVTVRKVRLNGQLAFIGMPTFCTVWQKV